MPTLHCQNAIDEKGIIHRVYGSLRCCTIDEEPDYLRSCRGVWQRQCQTCKMTLCMYVPCPMRIASATLTDKSVTCLACLS